MNSYFLSRKAELLWSCLFIHHDCTDFVITLYVQSFAVVLDK